MSKKEIKVYVLKNRNKMSGNVMSAGNYFRYATRCEADAACARLNKQPINKKLVHFVVEEKGELRPVRGKRFSERLADDIYATSRARGEDDALSHGL